ncbi:MAG: RNA 2'-phosphotransferase [Bacteroidia bacterium]|nr:RNA 2'-phosphotransferase [Bacteroidia bacterium]
MKSEQQLLKLSKFLSTVLRHKPERIGIVLDAQGWTPVEDLLLRANAAGVELDRAALEEVIAWNNKQRFALDESGTRIRASQGHSVPVSLGYAPQKPPDTLYHGTSRAAADSILRSGIEKRRRHQVHLSRDEATAISVGRRHGPPVVLAVDAARMHADGYLFYCSANGVWLTDAVPAAYVRIAE